MALRVSVQRGQGARSIGGGRTPDLVEGAVRATLEARGLQDAEISVTLLGDRAIAALNQRWLGHEGPTDVLSFALYDDGEAPVGDVYIGARQALRQARELGVPPLQELARLAIHGTLHVLGEDHPAGTARVSSPMWREQERILADVMAT